MRSQLVWQWDWRGPSLANLRILVCTATCDDIPQEQLRPIILGPDPIPVSDPRPGFAASQQGSTPTFDLLELVDGDILPPPPLVTNLYNDGGVLGVTLAALWPMVSPSGPGFWSNGGVASVGPGAVPSGSAPPHYYSQVTAQSLLDMGGNNLPFTSPAVGSGILWNPGGVLGGDVYVA